MEKCSGIIDVEATDEYVSDAAMPDCGSFARDSLRFLCRLLQSITRGVAGQV